MSNQQLPCPPGGEATFLTNAQRQLISKMRTLVAKHLDINNVPSFPELTGDIRLLRFLEGFGNSPEAATESYVAMLTYRARNGIDAMRQRIVDHWDDDLHIYAKRHPGVIPHIDAVLEHMPGIRWNLTCAEPVEAPTKPSLFQAGHLVVLECPGRSDPATLLSALSLEEYLLFEKHNMEHKSVLLDRLSRERGYLVKIISVRDMAGLGSKHLGSKGISLMTSVLKIMQGAYPEVIQNILIVNAPWLFSGLWRLLKPFIAPRTIEKFLIFSSADTEEMREQLRSRIGGRHLPQRYGGDIADSLFDSHEENNGALTTQIKSPPCPAPLAVASEKRVLPPQLPDAQQPAPVEAATVCVATRQKHSSQASCQRPESRKGKDEKATVQGEDDSIFSKAASLVASSSLLDIPRTEDADDKTRDGVPLSSREPDSSQRARIARPGFKRVRVIQEVRELLPGEKHRYDLDIDCSWRHEEHQRRGDGAKIVVAWQFALLSYLATVDVGFAASFQKKHDAKDAEAIAGKATTLVSPYERVACDDDKPCFGDWTTAESGTLTVEWDNSFSMFTSKHMHLLIEVWEETASDNEISENGGGGSFDDDAADNLKLASEKALDAKVEEKDLKAASVSPEKASKWSVLRSLGKTSFRKGTKSSDATGTSNGAPSKAEYGGVSTPPSATPTTTPTSVSSSSYTSFLERSDGTSGNVDSSVQDDKDDSSIIVNDVDDEVDEVSGGESTLSSSAPASGIGVIGSGAGFVFGSPSTWEMNLRKYLGEDEVGSESAGTGGSRGDLTSTKEENHGSFSFSSPSEMMARMKAKMNDLVSD